MTASQLITLAVLAAVVGALIWDRIRSDVVALTGAAVLLMTGVVRPVEVQSAFASPAILALASLFVIAYAMELSGLLDAAISQVTALCRRIGRAGLWLLIGIAGAASAFLNNTPIVVLGAPVVRDVAKSLGLSPKPFLIPLSYAAVLGGCCTLIGTSTNLLVNDMASVAGQPRFGIFEITPVGVIVALSGAIYLMLFSHRLIGERDSETRKEDAGQDENAGESALPVLVRERWKQSEPGLIGGQIGLATSFAEPSKLRPAAALASGMVFVGVVALATFDVAPIAACAFAGAVLLILMRVITADEAYSGLRPEVLMLIAGMVVLGVALDVSGLAAAVTTILIGSLDGLSPLVALIIVYGVTLIATELLSNATVAVLFTPIAVSLAEALQVSPRPFLVAVMIAASAAFATPFGYQTNVLVYQMGGYNYLDFVRIGIPLNLITWFVGVATIHFYFPF
jgi:di/tricarboxylate transporter